MSIKMMLEQFPDHRRQDPKRGAEARVFDALQNLDLDGHGLYEYRYRREGKQVDYPLWLHSMARFAVQVKGGQYEMDTTGQWFLRTPDGHLDRVQSPLEETADGCMEMRDGIREATDYKNFVAGLLIFTDMPRNEEMEHMARERYHVHIVWGLDSLMEDLERIAVKVEFRRPPKSRIAESEWRGLHELQFRGAGVPEARRAAAVPETERQLPLGSATINIQHLDRLIVLRCNHDPDDLGLLAGL